MHDVVYKIFPSMKVTFLWSSYYFLAVFSACNCKMSVSNQENMLSSDDDHDDLSSSDNASFTLCVLNATCVNHEDYIYDQNYRREPNLFKIRSSEYNLDGVNIEILEVGTFDSYIDIATMSKVLSIFVQENENCDKVKFCPESDGTQECVKQTTPEVLSMDEESVDNVFETFISTVLVSGDEKKEGCEKQIFSNDGIQNLTSETGFTLALRKYSDCIVLKTKTCRMVITVPCGRGVASSKVVVIYNAPLCDVDINTSSRKGLTGAWFSVIIVAMFLFVVIKAVAKTGATFLRRWRRKQLLPVSDVFGRAPNAATPLVVNKRIPRYYSAVNSPRCSRYKTCQQFVV